MSSINRIATVAGIAEVHDKPPRHCHKMIRETAQGICAAFYEQCAHDDMFFRQFPNQKRYVTQKWGAFVDKARETLAGMLAGNYPEVMKQEIMDALLLDTALKGADIQELH